MISSLFTFQRHEFNNQFASRIGDSFQDWFGDLARHVYSLGSIQVPRLTQGDGKLDALVLGDQIVYQCYAPQTFKSSVAAAKIVSDFEGAYAFLDGNLKKWVFLHNHPTGKLDKDCLKALNDLAAKCDARGDSIEILAWGKEDLWEALMKGVSFSSLQALFGSPNPVQVDFATLEELLLVLEKATYPEDASPVPTPSVSKLDFNRLGPAFRREIREGRVGAGIMDGYLASRSASDPEFAERLAQRFRERYQTHKQRPTAEPDDIYNALQLDAGWKASPDANRAFAIRVILAYFFDSCDIFENPPEPQ